MYGDPVYAWVKYLFIWLNLHTMLTLQACVPQTAIIQYIIRLWGGRGGVVSRVNSVASCLLCPLNSLSQEGYNRLWWNSIVLIPSFFIWFFFVRIWTEDVITNYSYLNESSICVYIIGDKVLIEYTCDFICRCWLGTHVTIYCM